MRTAGTASAVAVTRIHLRRHKAAIFSRTPRCLDGGNQEYCTCEGPRRGLPRRSRHSFSPAKAGELPLLSRHCGPATAVSASAPATGPRRVAGRRRAARRFRVRPVTGRRGTSVYRATGLTFERHGGSRIVRSPARITVTLHHGTGVFRAGRRAHCERTSGCVGVASGEIVEVPSRVVAVRRLVETEA